MIEAFKANSLPFIEHLFDTLEPELWNPYPLIASTPAQFSALMKSESMFEDMKEIDVRQFIQEMKIKGDQAILLAIDKMTEDQFEQAEVNAAKQQLEAPKKIEAPNKSVESPPAKKVEQKKAGSGFKLNSENAKMTIDQVDEDTESE